MGQVHDHYFFGFWFPSKRDSVVEPLKLVIVYRTLHEGTFLNLIVGGRLISKMGRGGGAGT